MMKIMPQIFGMGNPQVHAGKNRYASSITRFWGGNDSLEG
ncbi:hypothetical Protein YC6258_04657 [Gynuella sunshinyii YC6258]|uniref:Uncharacterized protein n=1 Tax=Gynuella sunshinyii YC6258 TaxID=1445510 RepID=A0A0C5W1Z4_9GAMM|nr:hypothetical Protein YC6258_04657 [Gynuella sunshinyii YC6258]